MPKLFVCQDEVQFVLYEEFDAQFVLKVLESMAGLGSVTSCGLVSVCDIGIFYYFTSIFLSCGACLCDFGNVTRHLGHEMS